MSFSDSQQPDQVGTPELTTSGTIHAGILDEHLVLRFRGDVRLVWCVALEEYCAAIFEAGEIKRFYVDLCEASNLDSTTLGVLAKLGLLARDSLGVEAELYYCSSDIERLVNCMGFPKVFNIVDSTVAATFENAKVHELDYRDCCEDAVRSSVIEAHKTLMDLSDENKKKFEGLVESLENKK